METLKINVYTFDELSNEAKQHAINNTFKKGLQIFESDTQDLIQSIEALCNLFNIRTGRTYNYIIKEADFINLEGIRLYKYLVNNYYNDLFKNKYIKVIDRHIKTNAFYYNNKLNYKNEPMTFIYSKNFVCTDAVLTGVYTDNEILKPIYEFLQKPSKNYNGFDLLRDIERSISEAFDQIEENENSEELRAEFLISQDYKYLSNGEVFNL